MVKLVIRVLTCFETVQVPLCSSARARSTRALPLRPQFHRLTGRPYPPPDLTVPGPPPLWSTTTEPLRVTPPTTLATDVTQTGLVQRVSTMRSGPRARCAYSPRRTPHRQDHDQDHHEVQQRASRRGRPSPPSSTMRKCKSAEPIHWAPGQRTRCIYINPGLLGV